MTVADIGGGLSFASEFVKHTYHAGTVPRTAFAVATAFKSWVGQPPDIAVISCKSTGYDIPWRGNQSRVRCPSRCDLDNSATAIGASIHPMSSNICQAAIVDRVLPVYGGEVLLTRVPGLASYVGKDVGEAVSVGAADLTGPAFHMYAISSIDTEFRDMPPLKTVSCKDNFDSLKIKSVGLSAGVYCADACVGVDAAALEGTGIYTPKSGICRAAYHSGVIGREGGDILVTKAHDQDFYFGSQSGAAASKDTTLQRIGDGSYTVAFPTPQVLSTALKEVKKASMLEFPVMALPAFAPLPSTVQMRSSTDAETLSAHPRRAGVSVGNAFL